MTRPPIPRIERRKTVCYYKSLRPDLSWINRFVGGAGGFACQRVHVLPCSSLILIPLRVVVMVPKPLPLRLVIGSPRLHRDSLRYWIGMFTGGPAIHAAVS